ncbi:MAG: thioesterase family protein [Candidatus Velthaea sp.]
MLELYPDGGEAAWLRSFSWSKAFRPRFFETDALGHVSNIFYTSYIEIARLDFFNSLGDPQRAPHVFGFVHNIAELTMRFVRPCFYDEALEVHTKVAKLGRSSAILEHAITSEGGSDIRTTARAALVGVRDDRSAPWSDAQRAILEPLVRA